MIEPLRVAVVDDEAPARRKLLRMLARHGDVEVVGEATNAADAVDTLRRCRPDVVFLDVQMPGGDGFSVVESLAGGDVTPRIVFVTAHDRYAVRAFEAEALDYLLKPLDDERLAATLERIRRERTRETAALGARLARLADALRPAERFAERLFVEDGERAFFIPVADVVRFEADRNYVRVHRARETHQVRTSMDALERRLDPQAFVRLNRSELVRIDAIREMEPWFHGEYKVRLSDGTTSTWSRRYVARRPELLRPP